MLKRCTEHGSASYGVDLYCYIGPAGLPAPEGCTGWTVVGVYGRGNSQCPFKAWLKKIAPADSLPLEVQLQSPPGLHRKSVAHEPHIHKVAHCTRFNSVEEVFGPRGDGILRRVAGRGRGV